MAATLAGLTGCGGGSAAPQPVRPTLEQLASEQLANFFPRGSTIPPPSAYEERIMEKRSLTFSDYEASMEATAQCDEKALPGLEAVLAPEPSNPEILDLSLQTPNGSPGRQATGTETSPSSVVGQAPSSLSTPPIGQTGAGSGAPTPLPPDQATQTAVGDCLAEYSALVSARWMLSGDILPSGEIAPAKAAFLHCLAGAGLHLPAGIADGELARMFGTPSIYNGMSAEESGAVGTCVSDSPRLLLTIGA